MKVNFFDYQIYSDDLDKISLSKKVVVNTINQYSFCVAEEDEEFKNSLLDSDILIPDGEGIVMISSFLFNNRVKKISGFDLHKHLLEKSNKEKLRCFYLGSTNSVLEKITKNLNYEYPDIVVETYSPPFKSQLSEQDNEVIANKINSFNPDIVFVGMTAPKQEKWVNQNKHKLNTKLICSIGAVFDFYAGTVKRPSEILINLKLEWFGRLLSNPQRLWKRYIYYGPIFLYTCVNQYFKMKFLKVFKTNPV